MTRSQILLPIVCLLILGSVVGLRLSSSRPNTVLPGSRVVPDLPPEHTRQAPAISRANQEVWQEGNRPAAPPLPESVLETSTLTASSWENPFDEALWQSSGWQFSSQGMQTVGTGASSATFGRPYQKLMLECDILTGEPGAGSWELRLATPNSSALMSFNLHDDRISVTTEEHDLRKAVLEKALAKRLSRDVPRQFRIVATGNRIVVSWDGRRLLTTEQLASQSGRDVTWSIHTNGAAFQIPRLRVEGD